jgi:hypothetical protein
MRGEEHYRKFDDGIWGRTSLRIVSSVVGSRLPAGSPVYQCLPASSVCECPYQRDGFFEDNTDVAGSRIGKWV